MDGNRTRSFYFSDRDQEAFWMDGDDDIMRPHHHSHPIITLVIMLSCSMSDKDIMQAHPGI